VILTLHCIIRGCYDETLIPLDYKDNGQITDDTLYELLVDGFRKGVYATFLIDCCHSGSVLDLPHVFTANSKSNGTKKVRSGGGSEGRKRRPAGAKKKKERPASTPPEGCTIS
jgi:hypothetical protein